MFDSLCLFVGLVAVVRSCPASAPCLDVLSSPRPASLVGDCSLGNPTRTANAVICNLFRSLGLLTFCRFADIDDTISSTIRYRHA
ncbi:hypothetical protein V1522DRAFT_417745 [Lipomyces starkeyi]